MLHPVGRRSCNNSWLRQGDNALGGKVPTKQGHNIVANVGGSLRQWNLLRDSTVNCL